ncbi:hypothetical protein AAF712_012209 [Marasmius tenuissimus]|uniref:Uncharacterized protein n=1 Tax=Marasmius tenuissimus TaxID=585030 RepID=A0ABR2ZJR8_9AGAR
MPAHKIYTTKKQQEEALRKKYRKYYVSNRETILERKRLKYLTQVNEERRARKAERLREQLGKWYNLLEQEYDSDILEELYSLESHINVELDLYGSQYMERLYTEYQCWNEVGLDLDNSPLEVSLILFNLALEIAGKISTAILHKFGTGREWNSSKRLIRRIRIILLCLQDLEDTVIRASVGAGIEGLREQKSNSARLQGKADPKGLEELVRRHS